MCGRYRRTTSEEELARLYDIPIPSQTDLPISYNIAPSQKVLTIWRLTREVKAGRFSRPKACRWNLPNARLVEGRGFVRDASEVFQGVLKVCQLWIFP
jgi:putative SOS response-associated peptidase YedK